MYDIETLLDQLKDEIQEIEYKEETSAKEMAKSLNTCLGLSGARANIVEHYLAKAHTLGVKEVLGVAQRSNLEDEIRGSLLLALDDTENVDPKVARALEFTDFWDIAVESIRDLFTKTPEIKIED